MPVRPELGDGKVRHIQYGHPYRLDPASDSTTIGASLMDFGRWITGLGPLLGNEASQNKQHDTSGFGEVGVYAGGAIDAPPTPDVRGFHWMDYQPDDGRYMLQHYPNDEFGLTPADAHAVADHLHKLIDATRRSAYIPGSG